MTEWDDWFRDDNKAGGNQVGGALPGAAAAGAGAEPTVQLPVRPAGSGPAAPLAPPAPAGGTGRSGGTGWSGGTAQPGGTVRPGGTAQPGGWPAQPAPRTAGKPPRSARFGTGIPGGGGGTGWRRWLRP